MKKIIWCLTALTTTVFAGSSKPKAVSSNGPKPGDYDYDLFSKNKRVVFVNAELLYWTVNESGADYAIQMKNPVWGPQTDAVGKFELTNFGWNPGFRGNIGYFNAPNYWDVYVQYTHFKGAGTDRTVAPVDSNLLLNGTWPEPDPTGDTSLSSAHSKINFSIDLLEWLVTRRFFPNPHLRMRLYGGLDVVWLRQNWEINYIDTAHETSHLRNQWRFNGAGIRLGCMIDWYMHIKGLYLTGAISGAGFAGSYRNVSRETSSYSAPGYDPRLPLRNAHYNDTRLVSHLQVMAGPSWQQSFEHWRAEICLSYEFNIWGNVHEVYRSLVDTRTAPKQTFMSNSIVGLQGASLRFNIDF